MNFFSDEPQHLVMSATIEQEPCRYRRTLLRNSNNGIPSLDRGFASLYERELLIRNASMQCVLSLPLHSIRALKRSEHGAVLIRHGKSKDQEEELLLQFDGQHSRGFINMLMELMEVPAEDQSLLSRQPQQQQQQQQQQQPQSQSPTPQQQQQQQQQQPKIPGVAEDAVQTEKNGVKMIAHPTLGFTSLISVEVTSPLTVAGTQGDSYVVYTVRSKVTKLGKQKQEFEWAVQHRYSDFEALDALLRKRVAENLDSLHVLLPVMPSKPWVPVGQFGRDWMESRCRKLNRFLVALCQVPELQKKPQYLDPLLRFLSEGELHLETPVTTSAGSSPPNSNWALFEKGVYGVNAALGAMLDKRETPTPTQDYEYIRDMFLKQGLVPKTVPWKKLVVTVLGTTSSGKSSFISHLFTVACAASSGAGQVDSGFSIIETCPEAEFLRYCGGAARNSMPNLTIRQLKEPIVPAAQNLKDDARYGTVFVYLDAAQTLDRYRDQLGADYASLAQYNKIRTVLINQRFLNGTDEEIQLAQKLILIDSKGIDASSMSGGETDGEKGLRYLAKEIKAFQQFSKMSNLTLFMLPANDIRNCEAALSVFELAVVCSEEGMAFLSREIKKQAAPSASASSAVHVHYQDPVAGLLSRLLGIDQLYGAAKNMGSWVGQKVSSFLLPAAEQDIDHGTARWEKTFFILSRVDELYRSGPETDSDVRQLELQVMYELGVAFGRRLNYLEPPTFSRVCTLGLPEKQPRDGKQYTGFLSTFKKYLLRQTSETTYSRSRDDSIIAMCEELERSLSSGWMSSAYFRFTLPYIREAKARANVRRFSVTE